MSGKEIKISDGRLWKELPTFALFIDLQLLNMWAKVSRIAVEIALAQRKPFCA